MYNDISENAPFHDMWADDYFGQKFLPTSFLLLASPSSQLISAENLIVHKDFDACHHPFSDSVS